MNEQVILKQSILPRSNTHRLLRRYLSCALSKEARSLDVVLPLLAPLNLQFQPYPSQPQGGYPASGYGRIPSGSAPHPGFAGSFNLHANQQQYPYAPSIAQTPPPPSGAHPPPPPPKRQPQPSMYYPSSQYPPQYNPPSQQPPPPPPASSPPKPSIPPPPPHSLSNQAQSVPPAMNLQRHSSTKVASPPGRQQKTSLPPMQQKPSLPPMQQKPPPGPPAARGPTQYGGPNGISVRMETEEERRLRKK